MKAHDIDIVNTVASNALHMFEHATKSESVQVAFDDTVRNITKVVSNHIGVEMYGSPGQQIYDQLLHLGCNLQSACIRLDNIKALIQRGNKS